MRDAADPIVDSSLISTRYIFRQRAATFHRFVHLFSGQTE